jgi:hypothetical protein
MSPEIIKATKIVIYNPIFAIFILIKHFTYEKNLSIPGLLFYFVGAICPDRKKGRVD